MEHYLQHAFKELFEEDGLMLMGRGLGIDVLFSKFVQYFSAKRTTTSASSSSSSQHRLIFCLNVNGYEDAMLQLLLANGAKPNELPKIINNEVNSNERSEMYQEGGCFFITSRIFIVDLLDHKVDASRISGLLIYNAHRISETSMDSFVIRVFRERNRDGFIKAFCEDPESLQSGFGRMERLLKVLYLRRLYLYPRFRLEIAKSLEAKVVPNVIELSLSLTKHMKAIQSAILVAMNTCVQELKKICPTIDTSQCTLEHGLFHSFDHMLRSQLDPEWHRIPFKSKQMLSDMTTLRKLLDYLIRYDAFSFYYLLLKLQQSSSEQTYPSLWLTSEAANKIFQHAKERVYSIQLLHMQCAWKKNSQVVEKVDEMLTALQLEHVIEPVLECPPKWNVLLEVVKEIQQEFNQQQKKSAGSAEDLFSSSGRVLLIVRDELAMTQIRDVLSHGAQYVMDQRFRWFVSQQSADIRKRSLKNKGNSSTTIINKQATHGKTNNVVKTTLDHATGDPNTNFEFNERVVEELLNRQPTADHAAESSSSASSSSSGYLDLGLPEREVKALSKESQLVLIQERILKTSSPMRSVQDQPSSNNDNNTSQPRKKQRTDATAATAKSSAARKEDNSDTANNNMTELSAAFLDPHLFLTIKTHSQLQDNFCWLTEFQPKYIILYDADVELIRNIEAYQSTIEEQVQIYFLVYEGSTEEHRYVGSLAKEKKAFESLIATKEHLVVSLPDHPYDVQKEKDADASMVLDSRTMGNKGSSNRGKLLKDGRKVVVDVREFRSTLPSILYSTQFQIIPRTINVGDFILSPEICVERKGISDLYQSFASGRLYNQVESMSRHYKYPCLLIEFTPDKPFCFMAPNEIGVEIQSNAIFSKLVLLTQSFPNLKILWSKSPENTAEIFKAISQTHDEVDVQKAVAVGSVLDGQQQEGDGTNTSNDVDDNLGNGSGGDAEQDHRLVAQEMLLSLPGINVHNFREVMNKVHNLAQLTKMSEVELTPIIGPGNAKKLVAFCRQKVM